VARQYCGRLGKQDNCQIAVTLSIANHAASLPIAYRLYLPEDWANDAARRKKAHVPEDKTFKTKPQIALDQIRAAAASGVAPGIVLADAGYGWNLRMTPAMAAGVRRRYGTFPISSPCSRQKRLMSLQNVVFIKRQDHKFQNDPTEYR